MADQFVDQAKETVAKAAAATTDTARQAYEQGRRYIDAARERYPEAERYYRESTHGVRQYAADNPLITLLVGVGIGYALAWVFLSGNSDEGARVPDYAKTKRGYSPHWPQPRA